MFKTTVVATLIFFVAVCSKAQTAKYILVRHAEKDTTQNGSTMMSANPPLNAVGEARAIRLITALKAFSIDSIYSTNFIRTINTAVPLAQQVGLPIQHYNHKALDVFANQLLQTNNKTFLVVGHSNTTPTLANLLSNSNTYKPLDESVYNKIYIVTIKNGKALVEVNEY